MSKSTDEINRLLWQSRRGALELDLLFAGYIREHYTRASPALQASFEQLLTEDDPNLMGWLLRHQEVPENYQAIVKDILARSKA